MILRDGVKMGKSAGNTIDPDKYDPDELRFYLMFLGHYFDGGDWSDERLAGIQRFINRFKEWMGRTGTDTIDVDRFQNLIYKYTDNFKFNKVVSEYMTLFNQHKQKNLTEENKKVLIDTLEIYMLGIREKLK